MKITSKEILVLAMGSLMFSESRAGLFHTNCYLTQGKLEIFARLLHQELEKRISFLAKKIEIELPSISNQKDWESMFFYEHERYGIKAGFLGKLKHDYLSWEEVFPHKVLKEIWKNIDLI